MALWSNDTNLSHDVYTVVYLLKDALTSSVEDAWFFERNACSKPDMKGASHAEIAARLGRYRDACSNFKEREALMLTKILRARKWANELKKLSPTLQDDIDQFLDATDHCQRLQKEFVNDAQRMFHGGNVFSRAVAQNFGSLVSADTNVSSQRGYLVGGHAEVFELRAACEVFLSQINDEFFTVIPDDEIASSPTTFMAYLEAAEEQIQSHN